MSNLIELAAERRIKLEKEIRAALGAKPNEADLRLKVLDASFSRFWIGNAMAPS